MRSSRARAAFVEIPRDCFPGGVRILEREPVVSEKLLGSYLRTTVVQQQFHLEFTRPGRCGDRGGRFLIPAFKFLVLF